MLFPMREAFSCRNKLRISSSCMHNSVLFLFILNQELLSRTSLETQKLDLMAEISTLKLKLTSVEKDRLDYEDRFRDTEVSKTQLNKLWKLCVASRYLKISWEFFFFFFARQHGNSPLRLKHVCQNKKASSMVNSGFTKKDFQNKFLILAIRSLEGWRLGGI